jgi:hypothetical protein
MIRDAARPPDRRDRGRGSGAGASLALSIILDSMQTAARTVAVRLLVTLPLLGAPATAAAQHQGWRTYTDTLRGYAFSFPPDYRLRSSRASVFLEHGDSSTEFYVEDFTRAVGRGMLWDLARLAPERAISACDADGPDGSTSCTVRTTESVANIHDLRILAVTRDEFNSAKPGVSRPLDPSYVVDLAGQGRFALLIIAPRLDQTGLSLHVIRAIVETIRRPAR